MSIKMGFTDTVKKHLKRQFKHRSINRRAILKDFQGYAFMPEDIVSEIPPGLYFPLIDTNKEFYRLSPYRISREDDLEKVGDTFQEFQKEQESTSENAEQAAFSQHYFPIENHIKAFRELDDALKLFLDNREFYETNHLEFRRSFLIYGHHGTGKTRYIFQTCDHFIDKEGAIVIRIETEKQLHAYIQMMPVLAQFCPGRMFVVVLEELREITASGTNRNGILNMLDSSVLRDNIIYLITTNYPEQIPETIIDRPSRIDELFGVFIEDFDADFVRSWYTHITNEVFPEDAEHLAWLNRVSGTLSLAYLKELIVRAKTHKEGLSTTYDRLMSRRQLIKSGFERRQPAGFNGKSDVLK